MPTPPREVDGPPRFDGNAPPNPGPGGFGAPQADTKLVTQFDKDGDKRLNTAERKAAREWLGKEKAEGRGPRRPGPPGGRRPNENLPPPAPGAKVSPADVKSFPDALLYDLATVRTVFLEFEGSDWEKELSDFYHTDVEVPATLTVDGRTYRDVGVHFRGASSFFTVGEGRKHSLNLSLDFVHDTQRLGGYRTLNLLNSHTDPTYLRSVLYYQAARDYIAAPKANYARVVINGESWGVFINAQQFNKDFTRDTFQSEKGARWKVPGSPRAQGGLTYLGDDVREYKKHYEIKSKNDAKSWAALVKLCKTLNETPADKLEAALAPMLDIDDALKFLALENVFINGDGYWVRTSDYALYQDERGRFHLVPLDSNETFRAPEGPGMGGGRGGPDNGPRGSGGGGGGGARVEGVKLDPMAGASDPNRPLLNKLLAVPALKARYLGYVRDMAERWLDWKKVGALARQYQALIAAEVKADTRKLDTFEAFTRGVDGETAPTPAPDPGRRGPRAPMSLKSFVEQRRAFLLAHPDVKTARLPSKTTSPTNR